MSELQSIELALKRAARRRRLERMWRGFWKGLLAAGLVWLLVFGLYKVRPLSEWWLVAAAVSGAALVLTGVSVGAWRKTSLLEAARWLDGKKQLQERLSTALEVAPTSATGNWKELLVSDAARHAKDLDLAKLLPLRLPVIGRWALLVLVLGVGLGFVPEYRSKAYLQQKKDAANIRETGKQLAEFTKRYMEQRPPVMEPTTRAMETVAELGDKLGKTTLTRSEALRDLASATERLSQQAKELGQNPAIKPLERAAREPGGPGSQTPESLQQQMQALQKSLGDAAANPDKLDKLKNDLQKAQQALANLPDKNSAAAKAARQQLAQSLSDLAKQARDMGQSLAGLEEAIQALQNNQTDLALRELQTALDDLEKLRDLAKAMQQLQQQAARLGKDLAEQLKNGQAQAAQQTLQKMIEQLKAANLSQEQLQKILEEVSKAVEPGSQYGKVGEHLKNATQQLAQGQKPQGAQSLADAAKELEKLMQQISDSQAMMAALEALERAQMAIAMCKGWGECNGTGCSACNGMGCWMCMGKAHGWGHGGKPGRGVGTWADETGWTYFSEDMQRWDNSGIQRPDMDPRGHTDRPDDLNPNLVPDKVRGQMSPGGSMPSITLKGVSIKGQSSVQYQEAAAAAQAEAQSALNQDQVPRAYQGTVRDYFDDLKK
jgi:hypothetical protein